MILDRIINWFRIRKALRSGMDSYIGRDGKVRAARNIEAGESVRVHLPL